MSVLYDRISKVESTNKYFLKDLKKATNATKFIGRGSEKSSTNKYMIASGNLANTGVYTSEDIVFVSCEGNRKIRVQPDFNEIKLAIEAGVTFITDNLLDRSQWYNIGERQVAAFLENNGYVNTADGIWCNNGVR